MEPNEENSVTPEWKHLYMVLYQLLHYSFLQHWLLVMAVMPSSGYNLEYMIGVIFAISLNLVSIEHTLNLTDLLYHYLYSLVFVLPMEVNEQMGCVRRVQIAKDLQFS